MCCFFGLRGTAVCAAIFTLVQSLIGVALASFVLVNYTHCLHFIAGNNTLFFFYFYRPECYSVINNSMTEDLNFVDRTQIMGLVYVSLNGCWLISSFLMAVCSCVPNPKKTATYFCYSPWIIVTVAVAITDLAATIIYFRDLQFVQDLLANISNGETWWQIVSGPLIMGLIFSRFISGWIINFGVLICVSILVVRMWNGSDEPQTPPSRQIALATTPPGRQADGSRILPGAPPLEEPDWNVRYVPHKVDRPAERPNDSRADQDAIARMVGHDRLDNNYRDHYGGANVQSIVSQQPKIIAPDPKYREAAAKRDEEKLSRNPKGYIPADPSPQQNGEDNKRNANPAAKQRPSYATGVRNQLPWSYFQNPADSSRAIPKQPDVDDDDRPPVPVPDYTLHIGKRPKNDSMEPSRSESDASSASNSLHPWRHEDRSQPPRERRYSREADVLY